MQCIFPCYICYKITEINTSLRIKKRLFSISRIQRTNLFLVSKFSPLLLNKLVSTKYKQYNFTEFVSSVNYTCPELKLHTQLYNAR